MNIVNIKFSQLHQYDWANLQNIFNKMADESIPFIKDYKGFFALDKERRFDGAIYISINLIYTVDSEMHVLSYSRYPDHKELSHEIFFLNVDDIFERISLRFCDVTRHLMSSKVNL